MGCGSCGHGNEANAKFCGECGALLMARCGSCEAEQPPGAKFCNQCGSPISATSAPEPAAAQLALVTNAVRKNVTALFGDLVGSTAFGERVDPEAARSSLAPYFEILRSTIEDHAGTVIKFTGDGVMAIFGLPEVAEDDALRAVAAGLELQRRFRGFAESVRDQHGVELGLRVGINTGELVTGDGDADLVGDVLNTAARLEAACQPGRVMVGEDTWRLTRSAVSYEVLGEVRVKGKSDALATFQVVDDDRGVAEDTTPFVGRRDELRALRSAFDDTRSSATAKLVTVIGAPGVGKTRLAAELRAGVDARSFDLRFERRGSTTFTPIVELLRELTGSGSAEDIALLVGQHAEATRLAGVLASFLGHGEVRSTEESFWAVRRLLEHLAATEPLVVVVDDIQWAEPLFWDLLDHLVEWTEAPVMLVALARPELRELRPELAQTGKRVTASVSLEGLDADTTRELAARLLDTDELPADLIERIPDSTEGNPLFVRELVQMLVDDGVLARDGDRWRLTIDADAIEVPPTVLSLLASRVERLPDDERQVVELASVIGTEFDRGLLGSLAGVDVSARLGALIDRLRRKDLIEPSGAWAGDHPVYRFHHVLIRDAAYRRLLKGRRADLHERVGRYLDDQGVDGDETDVVVAFHYEQVHRYRTELGTLDDATRALAALASERLRHAAEQALAREDLSSAGGYAVRALPLTEDDGERSELLLIGCEALLSSGDVGRGAALVEQMSTLDGDERLTAWADCFRAQLWSLTDSERLSEAAELADGAAGRLDALDDQAGVAKARLVRASTLARLGRIGECEAELDLALGAARTAGDRRRTVAVLGAAPLAALWGPSPVARAGGRCLDVLRLLRITTSSPAVEATSVRCQGLLEALRGRFESAHEKFEASRTTARDLGLRQGLYETELFEGFAELLADDPVAAEPHLRLARDGLGALGIGADAGQAAALLARSLLRQGRIDEADELATAALATAGENLQTAVASRAVLGEIRAVQGRAEEAGVLVAEAIEIAERTDIILDHAIALRSAARIAGLRGDDGEAERHRAASELLLADKGVTGLAAVRGSTIDAPTNVDDDHPAVGPGTAPEAPGSNGAATGSMGQSVDGLRGNAASAVWSDAARVRSREDLDEMRQRFHSDFVGRHRSHVFAALDDMDVGAYIEMVAGVLEVGGVFEPTTVALRGDDVAMVRFRIVVGDDVSDRLAVTRLENGLVKDVVTFDTDQLRDAYDELDRQWIEFAGGDGEWLTRSRALLGAVESGDDVAIRSQLDDGFVSVDHRPLGLGTRTTDDFVETFRSDSDGVTVIRSFRLVEPIEIGEGGALTWMRFTYSDGSTGEMLSVNQLRDGRMHRQEIFPVDRLDDARRCFDELTGPGSLLGDRVVSNAASLAFETWAAAVNDGDLDRYVAMLHPAFAQHQHQRLQVQASIGAADHIELTRTIVARGGSVTTDLLAVRGTDVALGRVAMTFGVDTIELINIVRLDDTGQIVSTETFEPEALHDALDRLDAIHLEHGGRAELVNIIRRMRRANFDGDREAVRGCLAPGWVFQDRRPLGLGVLDREGYVRSSVRAGTMFLVMEVIEDTGSVALSHGRFVAHDGSHWEHLAVMTYRDGISGSLDLFAVGDLRAARSRFDELVLADTNAATGSFTNTAWRVGQDWARALVDDDRQRYVDLMTADFVAVAQYRLDVGQELGPDDFAGNMFAQRSMGETFRVDTELVAVRGDNLCLAHVVGFVDDNEQAYLSVIRTTGERIAALAMYDDTQMDKAVQDLDAQWARVGGPARYLALRRRFGDAGRRGDLRAARALMSDRFVSIDHRPLGMGRRGPDEFLSTASELIGPHTGNLAIAVEPLAWTDDVLLYRHTIRTEEDLGDVAFDLLSLVVTDGRHFLRWDNYAVDQADVALQAFEAATAQSAVPELTNRAWEITQLVYADDMEPEFYTGLHHEDFVSVDHERFTLEPGKLIGREEYVASVFDKEEYGVEISARGEVIAVRGDDLCLVLNTFEIDGSVMERLVVVRTDDSRIVRTDWYDYTDLFGALDELDGQWVATGGPAATLDLLKRIRRAWVRRDLDAYRACLADDYVSIDHRPLGIGRFDADEHVESVRPMLGLERVVFPHVAAVLAWNDSTALQRLRIAAADDSTWEVWSVTTAENGRLTSMESYELDQFDAAQRRYRELTASPSLPPFANEATRLFEEFVGLVRDTGVESVRHLIGPGFVSRISQVSLMGVLGDVDADDHLALIGDALSGGASISIDHLIAIRGDHLCLHRLSLRRSDAISERLCVSRVEGGLAKEVVWFDGDGLRAALDELDRQWATTGGPAAYLAVRRRLADAVRAGDAAAARAVLAVDITSVDHRRLGLGTRNADEWFESISVIYGFESATTTIAAQPIAWTDEALLYRHTIDTGEDLGDVSWNVFSVVATDGDRITNWDNFDLDQLDAARARFDELASAASFPSSPTSREPSNEATGLSDALMGAGRCRDRDGFAALLDESFESVDLSRVTMSPGAIETRAEFISSTFDGDYWQAMVDGPVDATVSTQSSVVAVRGDTLALLTFSTTLGDDVVENLLLAETRDSRIVGITWFDGDDIHAALDLLDERYIALGGPSDVVMLNQRARHAERDGDRARGLALLAPEFHFDDRRRLGLGTMDRDEYVRTSITRGGHLHVDVEYVHQDEGVLLVHLRFETRDGSVWEYYSVYTMAASSFVSFSTYDLDDLDVALAEYERLLTTHRATASAGPAISNAASRVLGRSFEVLLEGGLDAHLGFIHPDFHFVVRRSTALGQEGGTEEWSDAITWWLGTDISGLEVRTHATRTESLTVGDLRVTTTAGDEWGFRYVVEASDGKLVRLTSHDTDGDGLLDALDELDRRWVEQGGPATVADLCSRGRRAIGRGNRDAIRSCVSDDFESVDHRALGLGHRTADDYVESTLAVAGENYYSYPTVVTEHDADGRHWLARWIRGSSSSEASWEFWTISVSRDGRLTRVETFDLADYDAALARYDELVAADATGSTASEPEFANAAWRVFEAGSQAIIDDDKDHLLDTLAADFVMVARRPFHLRAEIDREETADSFFVTRSLGATYRLETELIATRGDEFCLARVHSVIDDDNLQTDLFVVRAAGGRLSHMFAFDDTQLREALQELDREYGATLGISDTSLELNDAFSSLDPERTAPWLHHDFRFRDHRGIGWPDLDRSGYLTELLPSIPAGITTIVRQIDTFVEGRGMVEHHSLVDADGTIDTAVVGVSVLRDGQLIAFEVFAPDELAAARARFAELTADDPVSG